MHAAWWSPSSRCAEPDYLRPDFSSPNLLALAARSVVVWFSWAILWMRNALFLVRGIRNNAGLAFSHTAQYSTIVILLYDFDVLPLLGGVFWVPHRIVCRKKTPRPSSRPPQLTCERARACLRRVPAGIATRHSTACASFVARNAPMRSTKKRHTRPMRWPTRPTSG